MKKYLNITLAFLLFLLSGCGSPQTQEEPKNEKVEEKQSEKKIEVDTNAESISLDEIPAYSDSPYVVLNNNIPDFEEYEVQEAMTSYEFYSQLDSLGRCGVAIASIGKDLMPTEERESLSSVTPSGWDNEKYTCVENHFCYNRLHLIGFQLTGEQANELNLITGTRYMNVDGMLPFENMVADYVQETNNHVLYEVTPIFDGDNLVASGVQMQAYSVEDNGQGIQFNIYCYNVQPGVIIDYTDGSTEGTSSCPLVDSQTQDSQNSTPSPSPQANGQTVYVSKSGSKYHSSPSCSNMKNPSSMTVEEAQNKGLEACKKCW